MKNLINIHHQEIGAKMAEIGCGERISRIEKLMLWAQERALDSFAEANYKGEAQAETFQEDVK